jgi:ubiquinone/menaquinone biosynthesis C-methylase UbiE
MTVQFDPDTINAKLQATWGAGEYHRVATLVLKPNEDLVERMDLPAGTTMVDVAAGSGNSALAAARRGIDVLATDFVADLLDVARMRAAAEKLPIRTEAADAQALPFGDGRFDAAISCFGAMFAFDQEATAAEMSRVTAPGGKIGILAWTPDGFIGELFKIIGRFIPPAPGAKSPARWGTEAGLAELFPGHAIEATRKDYVFRMTDADAWLDLFVQYYGPTNRAFAAVGDRADALRADIKALLERMNTAEDHLRLPSAYLEAVLKKP